MADIGRWGGKAIVNADSSLTGHTITEPWTHVVGFESSAPVNGTNWFDDQGTEEIRVYVIEWS